MQTLTRAQRKAQLALIAKAWDALPELTQGWNDRKAELLAHCTEEERQHRKPILGRREFGITIAQASKQQAIRWLAEYVACPAPRVLAITELLHLRFSVCLAAAIAIEFRDAIRKAWADAGVLPSEILLIDYAALMQP